MDITTHQKISTALCGKPLAVGDGSSTVELVTTPEMAVDGKGLVHGGFIFGLADHAAMIAVNHPNVVLGASEVKFTKPVRINETVVARAKVSPSEGKKIMVTVTVSRKDDTVFEGQFTCFILDRHVLD